MLLKLLKYLRLQSIDISSRANNQARTTSTTDDRVCDQQVKTLKWKREQNVEAIEKKNRIAAIIKCWECSKAFASIYRLDECKISLLNVIKRLHFIVAQNCVAQFAQLNLKSRVNVINCTTLSWKLTFKINDDRIKLKSSHGFWFTLHTSQFNLMKSK